MQTIDTSAAAFLAGIVTSVHCVGMCGPLSCSWAISKSGSQGESSFLQSTALYHGGRLVSYGLAGALAGALGIMPLRWFQGGAGIVLPWRTEHAVSTADDLPAPGTDPQQTFSRRHARPLISHRLAWA